MVKLMIRIRKENEKEGGRRERKFYSSLFFFSCITIGYKMWIV